MDQVADAVGLRGRARTIIHALWIYLGPPTSRLSFTVFAAMLYLLLTASAYIPRLRSHEFSLALDKRIRELGGDISYNTRAEQILVEDGRVTGVVTSRGDQVQTRHVISNASPTLVYGSLISPRSAVPPIALQECNAHVNGVSAMVVYLGLDATPLQLGLHEYSYFVLANGDSDRAYQSFGTLEAPQAQATACLNNAIPDCSPPGTSIVSITTLFRPEAWHGLRPGEYVRTKNRIAAGLIAQFEKATGTSLCEHIEQIEVATPLTYARYTGGYGGTIYGYEPEPWDSLMPRLMTFRDEVHFEGLEFCGGYAFRCHGYSGAFKSGQTIALLTLKDMIDRAEIRP
jgi:prolycopene isomerase